MKLTRHQCYLPKAFRKTHGAQNMAEARLEIAYGRKILSLPFSKRKKRMVKKFSDQLHKYCTIQEIERFMELQRHIIGRLKYRAEVDAELELLRRKGLDKTQVRAML